MRTAHSHPTTLEEALAALEDVSRRYNRIRSVWQRYYESNKDAICTRNRITYTNNKEVKCARQRALYQEGDRKQKRREYYLKNRDRLLAQDKARRLRKQQGA